MYSKSSKREDGVEAPEKAIHCLKLRKNLTYLGQRKRAHISTVRSKVSAINKSFQWMLEIIFCIELRIINNSDSGAKECLLNQDRSRNGTCQLSINMRMDVVNLECISLFLRVDHKI